MASCLVHTVAICNMPLARPVQERKVPGPCLVSPSPITHLQRPIHSYKNTSSEVSLQCNMDLGVPNEILGIVVAAGKRRIRQLVERNTNMYDPCATTQHAISTSARRTYRCTRQCTQMAQRCAELVNSLREQEDALENAKLREAVDELEGRGLNVADPNGCSRVKSFMRQEQVADDIDTFNGLLDTHINKFQIIRSVDDLATAVGMRDDVPKLMQTIQEELKGEQPDTEKYQALRGGLDTLHVKTGILPPLTDLTGQVTKLSEHPVAEGGTADIYEGHWVGDEKVMLKAIRHVESGSRFRREVDIWRRLEHKNILRFYGICYIGPRLFAVAPWAEGGSLHMFIRKNVECDRMSEVASGLKYLHTFRPMIVHGDLRANVVISASEEALLTDFGLSKIVAEEEGMDAASTSLENAGSARWMARKRTDYFLHIQPHSLFQRSYSKLKQAPLHQESRRRVVLTGMPPFSKLRLDGQVIAALIQGNLPERPEPRDAMHQRGLSDEMWKLINQCWEWKPTARPEMRTLASEVRKLHTEHLRKYGLANVAYLGLLPTPPTSSGMSSSPGSSRLGQGVLDDSPRTINNELPKATHSPYISPATAIPIPKAPGTQQRLDTLGGLDLGSSPDTAYNWQGSIDRSPTIARVPQYRPRPGSVFSHQSDIAAPHPEGHPIINYDEHGNVLTGNLEGLVMHLLCGTTGEGTATSMDKQFRECFLSVYRGFARVEDLWPMLVDRYRNETNKVTTSYDPQRRTIKLREMMLAILNDWLELQAIEPKDKGFLLGIKNFIDESFFDEPLDVNWSRLQERIQWHAMVPQLINLNQFVDEPPSEAAGRTKWSELDAAAVAKQLMRIESNLFQKILPSDCATRLKNISDEELLNIPRFFKNNYRVEDWCLSLILFIDSNDIEKRAQAITFLKRVAEESLKIRSFSSAHAIMSALTHAHVNGLEYTWRLVDRRVKEGLKQMSQLLSDVDKYKNALNSNLQLPSVPILSIHLRDLSRTYKELQTQVVVEGEELVNFQKFTEVWKSIKELMKYQLPRPDIPQDDKASAYLEYVFAQIDGNSGLQDQLKAKSEELHRREKRDFNLRRLGMEDAGM
ncbi:RasGEF domain-containing protein [Rhizoctonia solani AG-1 IA]|uniref:RasGEF domain-containing protein n=1 Tax=Thanatephorus cucumeris (strain AG1-IA) TaxID=983506 RepID=L8X6X3_THACA|nr:RasGEF domain-containing protein [Rhizoctonia solani AG-1 IA]